MKLRSHAGVDGFLDVVGDFLLRDEARHNLLFGICTTLRAAPDVYPEALLWSVEERGDVVAAALMTPPFNLVVAQPRDEEAVRFLAAALSARLPGVTGALPEAETFAQAWGVPYRLRMAQGVYAVRQVLPWDAAGAMRYADQDDRELLIEWIGAFEAESIPADAPHHDLGPIVDRRLNGRDEGFALWENGGEVVSLSGFGGRTPHGTRIGPVYTPPPLRGRGYASALVGQVSGELLAGGLDYCFLYTDLANPTSNKIYMNVGYELVCESADYAFEN
jgi:predicted GNAT family acetyltransferase